MCPYTDVHVANLQMLHTIRVGLARDPVDTSRQFGLHAELADRLRTMAPLALWTWVHAVGPTALFVPRQDFEALITAPAMITGTLAAAHPPLPRPVLPA